MTKSDTKIDNHAALTNFLRMARFASNKNHSGLTLPELLVSLAILGLLCAISLPKYLNSLQSARQKDVANQISNIETSIQAYREEFLTNPTGWDELARISPAMTNTGSAKGSTFSTISSPNGGYYMLSITASGTTLNLTGTPSRSADSNWDIQACLNTQTGLSDIKLGTATSKAIAPVCT
jgi:prepilin-type N-terminal cleavage/methylation domain-containing protein